LRTLLKTGTLPPLPVENVSAFLEAVIDGTDATVSWTAADDWEDRFVLERQTNGGSWIEIAQPPGGSASFADSVPNPAGTYVYRIKAESSLGVSGYSDPATAAPAGMGLTPAQAIPTQNDSHDLQPVARLQRQRQEARLSRSDQRHP
jgi:hypothetical protein